MTGDERVKLEQGLFCEGCFAFADECYWHCNVCLEGAWGYCDGCVRDGRHCTHALEAVGRISKMEDGTEGISVKQRQGATHFAGGDDLYPAPLSTSISSRTTASKDSTARAPQRPFLPSVPDPTTYAPLSIPTSCSLCHRFIPPSHARFHCPTCSDASSTSHDICNACYHNLCGTGKIGRNDGVTGWRRCLRGHRMVVLGFEDREGGQRRVVVRDLVGGWALKEEGGDLQTASAAQNAQLHSDTLDMSATPYSQRTWRWKENDGSSASHAPAHARPDRRDNTPTPLPPNGGVGLRVQALWSYSPGPEVKDELSFPRGAEITEAEDINGDCCGACMRAARACFLAAMGGLLVGVEDGHGGPFA